MGEHGWKNKLEQRGRRTGGMAQREGELGEYQGEMAAAATMAEGELAVKVEQSQGAGRSRDAEWSREAAVRWLGENVREVGRGADAACLLEGEKET